MIDFVSSYQYVRARCLDLYQPVTELSVDERMVKSRARCHMVQYMKNKRTKFGFKLWVVDDPSGYRTYCNLGATVI